MRLKRIKLAGFKSFVEPTSVSLPHDLIGVVGPNGCGKSNIIDAVRWVMGEISAKLLRGDSMEDVIFNGSSSRKPVSKAFVELFFDNTDGRVQGAYSKYAEINVRREVSRDGQSKYFLNKSRVRRRDVMDLFLGTGLGPRSYSIIEQGMVNRVVESRPEELRLFIEEAAGISKYKERRKETENRIKRTRENLERVEDLRQELDKQLNRLQRQSRTAEKYKALKNQERQLKAQLAAIRWLEIGDQLEGHKKNVAALETELEAAIAKQREKETLIEELRQQQTQATDTFNSVQAEFYDISADVARLEQTIKHEREKQEERQHQKDGLERTIANITADIQADNNLVENYSSGLSTHKHSIAAARTKLESVTEELQSVETRLHETGSQLGALEKSEAQRQREKEVQQVRIVEVQDRLQRRGKSELRLGGDFQQLSERIQTSRVAELKKQLDMAQQVFIAGETELKQMQADISKMHGQLNELRTGLGELREQKQGLSGRLESLLEIQGSENDAEAVDWVDKYGLKDENRLYRQIKVEPGWEVAVDTVLGNAMQAWCVDNFHELMDMMEKIDIPGNQLAFFQTGQHTAPDNGLLLSKISGSAVNLRPVLAGVYIAENPQLAVIAAGKLKDGESVVTRDGALLGPNWSILPGESTATGGALARQSHIDQVQLSISELDQQIETLNDQQKQLRETSVEQEKSASDLTHKVRDQDNQLARIKQELSREEVVYEQNQSRLERMSTDLAELRSQITEDNARLVDLQKTNENFGDDSGHTSDIKVLSEQRDELRQMRQQLRLKESEAREYLHKIELDQREMQTAFDSAKGNIQRLQSQLGELDQRRQQLLLAYSDESQPVETLSHSLETRLNQRLGIQEKLDKARNYVSELDAKLRETEQHRHDSEASVQAIREKLEKGRMYRQELLVRRETMVENMAEHGVIPEQICQTLPEDVSVDSMSREVADVSSKIIKLGAVNLAAIDEFEEQKERKTHIDSQYDDLVRALDLLEESIRKINRETRTRFRETFDAINQSFQKFFPRLFGGGHAILELTGDDMLDAGVTVMARPPGKRNSTIHLLSGGEKALTAVSLVFAIFELNPAPFCLLDEVDAPLDDANVVRYTNILRDLSKHSQLIFITHNKITMEASDILIGVTMGEPGVSRLVAVDIDQAVELAAQAG